MKVVYGQPAQPEYILLVTVEVVAKFIFDAFLGEMNGAGAAKVTRVEIRVAESDVATASYFEESADGVL